jgi:hypothetical protein
MMILGEIYLTSQYPSFCLFLHQSSVIADPRLFNDFHSLIRRVGIHLVNSNHGTPRSLIHSSDDLQLGQQLYHPILNNHLSILLIH